MATVGVASAALTGTAKAVSPQPLWAWCIQCSGMWYTGNGGGVCPYLGIAHNKNGSYIYTIYNNLGNISNPQGNWRWCHLCQGLFTTLQSGSHCMANNEGRGGHEVGPGSFDYYLSYDVSIVSDPQSYWRWCGQCQGLYHQGASGTQNGTCPNPLGSPNGPYPPHREGSGSFNYAVPWNGTYS
jgi:hypothetical protein